jgi:hypothetical protein
MSQEIGSRMSFTGGAESTPTVEVVAYRVNEEGEDS